MADLSISRVEKINLSTVREILASQKISDSDKINFMRKNSTQIKSTLKIVPTSLEYQKILKTRKLIKFRPLKNSLTKRGDKILLAKTLNMPVSEVDDYIKEIQDSLKTLDKLDFLPATTIDAIRSYIYRHGNADQLVIFFNHELAHSKNILTTLYKSLEYNNNSVADYFVRPIHRMSNKTLLNLYNTVDKNLTKAQQDGLITEVQSYEASEWAIKQIYQIQHNSKFINAVRVYNVK